MAKTSQARLKANDKYIKSLDEFKVRVKAGQKDVIKKHAESKGMSLNGYINALIEADMKQGD